MGGYHAQMVLIIFGFTTVDMNYVEFSRWKQQHIWTVLKPQALHILDWSSWACQMDQSFFQVDIITFNISLSALSRVSKWIQALTMLRLFNQTLQFNVITLSSVVTSCARVIAWLSSLNLLERTRIMSQPINEILMNSVMASMGMGEKSWRRRFCLCVRLRVVSGGCDLLQHHHALHQLVEVAFLHAQNDCKGHMWQRGQSQHTGVVPAVVSCFEISQTCRGAWCRSASRCSKLQQLY